MRRRCPECKGTVTCFVETLIDDENATAGTITAPFVAARVTPSYYVELSVEPVGGTPSAGTASFAGFSCTDGMSTLAIDDRPGGTELYHARSRTKINHNDNWEIHWDDADDQLFVRF